MTSRGFGSSTPRFHPTSTRPVRAAPIRPEHRAASASSPTAAPAQAMGGSSSRAWAGGDYPQSRAEMAEGQIRQLEEEVKLLQANCQRLKAEQGKLLAQARHSEEALRRAHDQQRRDVERQLKESQVSSGHPRR